MKSLIRAWLSVTPLIAAHLAPPSMGFFQVRVLEWVAIAFSLFNLIITKYDSFLKKEMAAHSSILAWTEDPGSYSPMGHKSRTWIGDLTITTTKILFILFLYLDSSF